MLEIEFVQQHLKLKKQQNQELIWDIIRKKWLVITPEEWVRQNIIHYLVFKQQIPKSALSVEKQIAINDTVKRFDIVIFKHQNPWMLIECKATTVKLSATTLQQSLAYHTSLHSPFILLTNGNQHYLFMLSNGKHELLTNFPMFEG